MLPQSAACCSAAYIVALLHDGFKLGMHERRLRFTNYVQDPQGNAMDVDWTLGRLHAAASCSHLSCLIRACMHVCYNEWQLYWDIALTLSLEVLCFQTACRDSRCQ